MIHDATHLHPLLDALSQAQEAARLGQFASAARHASLACSLAQAHEDPCREAQSRTLLSNALFSLGRFEEALSHGASALAIWRRRGDAKQECHQLRLLAHTLSDNDLTEHALELAQAAFDRAEQAGLLGEALTAAALRASLHARLSDFDTAEALLLQVLSRARDGSDEALVTMVINGLVAMLLSALQSHQASGDARRAAAARLQLRRHATSLLQRGESEPNAFRQAILRSNAGAALAACGELGSGADPAARKHRLVRRRRFPHRGLPGPPPAGRPAPAGRRPRCGTRGARIDRPAARHGADMPASRRNRLALRSELARRRGEAEEARHFEARLAESREARAHRAAALRDTLKLEALGLPARVDAMPYTPRRAAPGASAPLDAREGRVVVDRLEVLDVDACSGRRAHRRSAAAPRRAPGPRRTSGSRRRAR